MLKMIIFATITLLQNSKKHTFPSICNAVFHNTIFTNSFWVKSNFACFVLSLSSCPKKRR